PEVVNAIIYGNVYGILSRRVHGPGPVSAPPVAVRNSVITNNTSGLDSHEGCGPWCCGQFCSTCYGSDSIDLNYSDLWSNQNNVSGCVGITGGAGLISENPQYVSPPDDFHLQSTSICIDSGAPTDAPDHDLDGNPRPLNGDGINSAEFDMGAYEFAG